MALLIPLLLPHVVQATTNIGIGISNAIQGTSSSVSFQIGNKVFTTSKGFNLSGLPYDLRRQILLMALTESKDLILSTPYIFDPTRPMTADEFHELQKQNPLHPDNAHYRSIVGDRISANGYPISSWRWMTVCTEWNSILKDNLWAECDLAGYKSYLRFIKLINGDKDFSALPHIRSLTFREGFQSPTDIYSILANQSMTKLEEVSILPNYPTSFHQLVPPMTPFQFGLQLIPVKNSLKALTFGLPLEITTNAVSRQHLKNLRVPRLTLTFVQPTVALFQELKDLVAESTEVLGIRYVSVRHFVDCTTLLCEPLQSFKKIELFLHLPRPRRILSGPDGSQTLIADPNSPTAQYITRLVSLLEVQEEEVKNRYTVYNIVDWEIPSPGTVGKKERVWPTMTLEEESLTIADGEDALENPRDEGTSGNSKEVSRGKAGEGSSPNKKNDNWERQTDLRLFGGLIGLRLESKKH